MTNSDDEPRIFLENAVQRTCRFVDWWFTPRWRALLMWVVVPGPTFFILLTYGNHAFNSAVSAFTELLAPWVPGAWAPFLSSLWHRLPFSATVFWCQPLALRLGWWRSLIWLMIMSHGSDVFLSSGGRVPTGFASPTIVVILLAAVMIGRRRFPWIIFPAAIVAWVADRFAEPLLAGVPYGVMVQPYNLIMGCILIFGTAPIEPREEMPLTTPGPPL